MSHMRDPFIDALYDDKLMHNLRCNKDIGQKLSEDPDFCKTMEDLHKHAKQLLRNKTEAIDWTAMGARTACAAYADPRVMQAVMSLYGKPFKVGEDFAARPREPLQEEHLNAVQDLEGTDDTKAKGNEFVKAGKYAMALAHYQRALVLVRMREQQEPAAATVAALLNNSALCFLKLGFPDRAKSCTSQALRALEKAQEANVDKSKFYFRRAQACEMLEEYSQGVDDLKRALQEVQRLGSGPAEEKKINIELRKMLLKFKEQVKQEKERDAKRGYWDAYVHKDAVAEYQEANKWTLPGAEEKYEPRFKEDGREHEFDKWTDRFSESGGEPGAEIRGAEVSGDANAVEPSQPAV